jgi:aminobenzoyl-glutamate transport protein
VSRPSLGNRLLDRIERIGNKLPDPAVLFVIALAIVWVVSALLDGTTFEVPSKDGPVTSEVQSQLTGEALAAFLAGMVKTFTGFHPLGVVLVAMLGVGVAEQAGFVSAAIKRLVAVTPRALLTPMLILVAILSHTTADAGFVLVIPLGGVIFYAAGRHPLAGIAAAFAGVSGGFSACPVPTALDPLLQGLSQEAAHIIDPARDVNPLCNWFFMACSSLLIIGLGWFITDRIVEPRLRKTEVDGDPAEMPKLDALSAAERRGLLAAGLAMLAGIALLVLVTWPADSPLRGPTGSPTDADAPLMQAIIPLIFLLFLVPGVIYGYVAGTFTSHRDVVKAMAHSMSTMGYYLVMAFFAALFIDAFNESQLGKLLAVEGAGALQAANLPPAVTVVGIILMSTLVNLLIGSASAKWALLAPIFVPMLMSLGLSPELTQAAYRVGDSSTNIITPLMPYFPLVVVYCQRYATTTGIGTLVSTMLPYSLSFLTIWTIFLAIYWMLGIPLGLQAPYTYPN